MPAQAESWAESIALRPATPEDEPFLLEVYASTRAPEMALAPWTDAQKDAFVRQQFHAQHTFYHQHWPDAAYDVLVLHNAPVGRLYVDRSEQEIGVMDIALLPEYRGRGIGSVLLKGIVAESERTARPVRLYVERDNPARRLYDRLGFSFVRDEGPYVLLERLPGAEEGHPRSQRTDACP